MFLNKIFHFLKGYVILKLTGFNIERFLFICAKRKIHMWSINKQGKDSCQIVVLADDFPKLRDIARKTRTKVHIINKSGLPILLKKYKKRYFMLFGCVIFVLMLFISTKFIWSVEISGVENADVVAITKILKDSGIYQGAPKYRVRSSKEIKNIILNRVDNISWAWVYLKGTKAVCEIFEDSIPGMNLEYGEPCHVIAARDGIIKRIIATDGIKTAKAGDTVLAGDMLISGVILNNLGEPGLNVAAAGDIEAYTWHEKTGTYKLYDEIRIPTGEKKSFLTLNLFSKEINLFLGKTIPFKEFNVEENKHELKLFRDTYLGIGWNKVTAYEVNVEKKQISYDMAVYEGKCELEEKIAKELLPGAELVSENVSHRSIDDETVEVTVTMGFIERIGRKVPIDNIQE